MDVRVADHPEAERYEAFVGDELAGFVTYRLQGDRISLLHTEVDKAFGGQGVGGTLVSNVLADVRARGLELLPFCPFVRAYLERHSEQLDLVPEAERERFGL